MLLGRILGTFIAVSLMSLFPTNDPSVRVILILLFTAIGVVVGILGSVYFGPNLDSNRPFPQDSLEYWTAKYGKQKGKEAYKIWLEELQM